jgi:hypothetical protein
MIDPTTYVPSSVLDTLGGEPLLGSGFEDEESDDSFEITEAIDGHE